MIVVTGATGHLGQLVVAALVKKVPAAEIIAAVRTPEKAKGVLPAGVQLRQADYNRPETLAAAFAGADKLLLISSNELGQREPQHKAVIAAAVKAGVKFIAYTSILHADSSPLGLADEHKATEAALRQSGLKFTLLRNSWYAENYAGSIAGAPQSGAIYGSAGEGKIAAAARADYAEAAAAVLTAENPAAVYELAGDAAFTMTELAAEVARQSGKPITYQNLPEADYKALLDKIGLPAPVAAMLADSDAGAAKGGLFDDSHTLSKLIGRATTPISAVVAGVLKG